MKKFGLLIIVLSVFTSISLAQIISQYVETEDGTTPKGIEIWNNTGATLDFTANNLVVKQGTNGGALATLHTINSGTLNAGAVLVIGTSDMETTTTNNGAAFYLRAFAFNGDDALSVEYGSTVTDIFGTPGTDPGTAWTGSGVSTANQNIQLKSGITAGDLDGWSDPSLRFETVSTTPSTDLTGFGLAPVSGSSPTVSVNPTSLSGFTYVVGSGPSAEQTFAISGSNLTADISIAASTNYEISETSGSGYTTPIVLAQSDGSVGETTIYVRLKAGLSVGDYNSEDITATSTDATDRTVTCSGSVTPSSVISVVPATLTGFTYVFGSGPSTSQNYDLSGTNLTPASGNLTVTGSTNYEVSTDNSTFTSSVNVAYTSSTLASATIYVRLKSGLSVGTYNSETISNAGGGAITENVTVSGNVTPIISTLPMVENFDYTASTELSDYGWAIAGTNYSGNCNVATTGLSFTGYPSSGIGLSAQLVGASSYDEVSRGFTQQTSGSVYYSFLVNVTSNGGASYFTGLQPAVGTSFNLRVFCSSTSGNSTFGLGTGSTGTYSSSPTVVSDGSTVLLVLKYTVSGTAKLFVITSSIPESEPSTPEIEISEITSFNPSAVFLRQDGSSITGLVDGLRIATSWGEAPLPVELSSFSASVIGSAVKLNWRTETEVNNYGFEILRSAQNDNNWIKLGFVEGYGNSNSPKDYSFVDASVISGTYSYRLKQIDIDGQFEYSKIIEVNLGSPKKYELAQNFPNPFNPNTSIKFTLPETGNVKLTVYNMLGQEIATLVNGVKEAGTHIINFNAEELNSGVYIYRIESSGFNEVRKMTLIK